MKRTGMMSIREILRHRHGFGLTRAQVAAAVGVSTGTVSHVLERASAAGLSWPLPGGLDDEALRARLYPATGRDRGWHVQPDWKAVLEALHAKRDRRRARMTRRQLWVEYRDEAVAQGATAYGYSRFCALLNKRLESATAPAQMRFVYAPGLYGLSDFSGKTLAIRTGRGERDVEIFVAVLAHSCLTYAEAVPNQKVRHWTMAHRRALEYFGGVPRRWVIDNLKSGVDKPDREEPQLNPSFREFALHYDLAVLPARPGRPTDKGAAESAVGAVQSRILLALRHETFFSLEAMNAAIRRELERLNHAPMASGESRRAVFEASERATLAPLPAHPWEWGEWLSRKVAPNCHIRIERNHYSVPARHVGHSVEARLGERMVEVFLARGGERIAVHRRQGGAHRYSTRPEHMPERHRAVRDLREPDYASLLLARARRIGPNALAWAERCFASRDFPEQAFATVQGMTRLAETYECARIDALCVEALDLNRFVSGFIRERLKKGADPHPRHRPEPDETIPDHDNIRGGAYYRNDEGATP